MDCVQTCICGSICFVLFLVFLGLYYGGPTKDWPLFFIFIPLFPFAWCILCCGYYAVSLRGKSGKDLFPDSYAPKSVASYAPVATAARATAMHEERLHAIETTMNVMHENRVRTLEAAFPPIVNHAP